MRDWIKKVFILKNFKYRTNKLIYGWYRYFIISYKSEDLKSKWNISILVHKHRLQCAGLCTADQWTSTRELRHPPKWLRFLHNTELLSTGGERIPNTEPQSGRTVRFCSSTSLWHSKYQRRSSGMLRKSRQKQPASKWSDHRRDNFCLSYGKTRQTRKHQKLTKRESIPAFPKTISRNDNRKKNREHNSEDTKGTHGHFSCTVHCLLPWTRYARRKLHSTGSMSGASR